MEDAGVEAEARAGRAESPDRSAIFCEIKLKSWLIVVVFESSEVKAEEEEEAENDAEEGGSFSWLDLRLVGGTGRSPPAPEFEPVAESFRDIFYFTYTFTYNAR